MIEFCSKKRMIFAIVILISVSIIVLVVESRLPFLHELKDATKTLQENLTKACWEEESVSIDITDECKPCSSFEKKEAFCLKTGYREKIVCKMGDNSVRKEVYRSCPKVSWLEEKRFWMFESVVALCGIWSYIVVCLRQKRLDRLLIEKVNRQIAAGI